jgi:circadian clock protein KaiB
MNDPAHNGTAPQARCFERDDGRETQGAYCFRIYLAGGAPNSVRALANLYAICRTYFRDCHHIEVIDVLKDPLRALADAILVTPTVVMISPLPQQKIIGNLSDEDEVLRALGLPRKENA